MSLSSLLSIARSALVTHQTAIGVTSHNIANANTPGFSRQRLTLQAAPPLRTPSGTLGTGVTASGVHRARDSFLDAAFRRESALLGGSTLTQNLLTGVEQLLGEPSDAGLGVTLDDLFTAFSDLANDPSSLATRTLARDAGRQLADRFRALAQGLAQTGLDATDQLRDVVGTLNTALGEVAQLNAEIVSAGGANRSAADLSDQRDQILDNIAGIGALRAIPRDNGTVAVVLGDQLVVDGAFSRQVELRALAGGGTGVAIVGTTTTFDPGEGRIRALTTYINTTLPDLRTTLDQLAAAVVTEVNTIHQAGTTPAGATATNFFDPAGLTAQTMVLAAPVDMSPLAIATGATAAPGDNAIALALAGLRTLGMASLGGATAGEFYISMVGAVGVLSRNAGSQSTVSDVLVSNLETRRSSVSGVSVDEEMVNLIGQQQAFAAASRIVTVADEMMQDILRMV